MTTSGSGIRREKLELLAFELGILLFGRLSGEDDGLLTVTEAGEPKLWIGRAQVRSMSIELDAEAAYYILREHGEPDDCLLVTKSLERLVDHVLSQLARDGSDLAPKTADMAIDLLVGQSINCVERRLILKTIQYFRGDFERAACALQLSTAELHGRTRSYLSQFHTPSVRQERR